MADRAEKCAKDIVAIIHDVYGEGINPKSIKDAIRSHYPDDLFEALDQWEQCWKEIDRIKKSPTAFKQLEEAFEKGRKAQERLRTAIAKAERRG